jgi:UDP-glucose 4-epimerase
MRVIVTGGAGFIGPHVVDALLARGDEVHVVDDLSHGTRSKVPQSATLHVHDVREPLDEIVRGTGTEAIVHLAAQADVRVSVAEPALDATINVLGTVNVLEAARLAGARVVFASTGGAIYGECARPAREDDPCLPLSPYGAAKLAGEGYLGAFARLHGMPHVALRFGNVYGPGQDPHGEAGVVAIFLGKLLERGECRIFGDGSQSRDYVYVGDVARATMLALESEAGGVLNVGTGIPTSVLELYAACRAVAGSDATPVHEPARAGELARSVLDPEHAAAAIGFRPETSLAEGLAATWRSLQPNP